MEKKIILSEEELGIIQEYLNGEIGMMAPRDKQKLMMQVGDKAEALMFELDAVEESGDDLIVWFYKKYLEQEGIEVKGEIKRIYPFINL